MINLIQDNYIVQNKESVKLLMFTAIDLMMRLLSKLIRLASNKLGISFLYKIIKAYFVYPICPQFKHCHEHCINNDGITWSLHDIYTVNVERFAGLNVHGFSPMKVFVAILLRCLGQQCVYYLTIVKYSWEQVLLKTVKVLAQRIFPRLR